MEQAILTILIVSACVSVGAAVGALLLLRRGTDADLKADVGELATFVEKLAKETRREKMRRVRAGQKDGTPNPEAFPIPPGAEAMTFEQPPANSKDELRRRVSAARRQ